MNRKFLRLILTIFILSVSFTQFNINATYNDEITTVSSTTDSGYFTFNTETSTILTYSSYTGAPKDIVIPTQIGGHDVLHIGDYAFAGFQLTSIKFEDDSKLETIGTYAFYNNLGFKGVFKVPEAVQSIGNYAFLQTNLYALIIGENTSYTTSRLGIIQDFRTETEGTYNYNETALVIDEREYDEKNAVLIDKSTNTLIRHYPEHIDNATSVVVPEGVEHIGEYAYYSDQL